MALLRGAARHVLFQSHHLHEPVRPRHLRHDASSALALFWRQRHAAYCSRLYASIYAEEALSHVFSTMSATRCFSFRRITKRAPLCHITRHMLCHAPRHYASAARAHKRARPVTALITPRAQASRRRRSEQFAATRRSLREARRFADAFPPSPAFAAACHAKALRRCYGAPAAPRGSRCAFCAPYL